jgi:uncharacterized protein YbjT (DUF2867 family)
VARVLVTGGTGTLGSVLVQRLVARGHEVTALSRHSPRAPGPRVAYVRGDVLSGEGVDAAVAGVDAVVHTATAHRRVRETEVTGTRRTLESARRAGAHFVYVSIVGIDRVNLGYYRAKLEAEGVVGSAGAGWTVQRATQFHDLVDTFLRLPAFPVTRRLAFQPVGTGDVSERLVDLVEAGPSGRADDMGGPEVMPARELATVRRRLAGRSARLVPVPAVGFLGDLDRGANLCPDRRVGTQTWEGWLTSRLAG